jgi:TonB family protein
MSWTLIFQNLVAYSLQIGMLVGVAAAIPTVLRLRQPGVKLAYWQVLLAICLLLPLQPWKQAAATGTVQITTVMTAVRPVHHVSSRFTLPRGEMVLLILLAGVAIRLVWLAVGFWKLRRYRRHSRPLDPAPAWSVEAALLVSDDIASPVTFGWRKPVVLLPAHFPELDARVQDAILCHEIMHVRRGDWLFTVAEELVRAIFWFHPAIWWLLGEIGLAREQEVDRLAIEITHEREHYMDALLAIAGAGAHLDLAPAPLFLRKRHLRHRVILILQEAHMSKTRLISTLTTGLAVLVAACWLATGVFPLTAEPQEVNDAAGVTVNLNGSTVLHRAAVHYPASALQHGVQGAVSVEVKLDATGNVSDAHVLSGPDELRAAVLQSVLEWHFTRDAANSTREVQVAFELPAKGVEGGITGGVQGGVSGGVLGGIIGGVAPNNRATTDDLKKTSYRIAGIVVTGLSDQATDELLATLPVHEGDEATPEDLRKVGKAISDFDEHLTFNQVNMPEGSILWISAGPITREGMEAVRNKALSSLPAESLPPPPPPPAGGIPGNPPQRIKVNGNVQSAMIVSKVPPVYPELAKSARVQGVVRLAAVIGKDGTMQELHVLEGPPLLVQAAMDAVKQWTYRPTMLNGEPISVETTIEVNFTLNQ